MYLGIPKLMVYIESIVDQCNLLPANANAAYPNITLQFPIVKGRVSMPQYFQAMNQYTCNLKPGAVDLSELTQAVASVIADKDIAVGHAFPVWVGKNQHFKISLGVLNTLDFYDYTKFGLPAELKFNAEYAFIVTYQSVEAGRISGSCNTDKLWPTIQAFIAENYLGNSQDLKRALLDHAKRAVGYSIQHAQTKSVNHRVEIADFVFNLSLERAGE